MRLQDAELNARLEREVPMLTSAIYLSFKKAWQNDQKTGHKGCRHETSVARDKLSRKLVTFLYNQDEILILILLGDERLNERINNPNDYRDAQWLMYGNLHEMCHETIQGRIDNMGFTNKLDRGTRVWYQLSEINTNKQLTASTQQIEPASTLRVRSLERNIPGLCLQYANSQ